MRYGHLIDSIVQFIELIKYHFWFLSVYFVFSYDYWSFGDFDIKVNYELINKIILIYFFILSLYSPFMTDIKHYFIYIFYLFVMIVIFNIGQNKHYFFIGLSSILFLTEWYELPIYLYKNFNWFTISGLVIISKLLMIIYVMKIMKDINLNHINFIINILIFSIPYVYIGFIGYISISRIGWIYRFLCASVIVLFIYKEKHFYNVKM